MQRAPQLLLGALDAELRRVEHLVDGLRPVPLYEQLQEASFESEAMASPLVLLHRRLLELSSLGGATGHAGLDIALGRGLAREPAERDGAKDGERVAEGKLAEGVR